ncbi:MAG: gamma-glutamyl-gamma-aminobutyrate hydrolase family protein, partial [Syntrophomonadaceae bacterium]|nr:gamma-glutamyl-gamma-aminobutyrate hydrolase family protein [Syntrophomonadaceae bacterium]MDD3899161.1 gamma-glutamyl-gamma-aminobutyrate hydrolase family protein [Syntrophomonadaceae bacterium]
YDCNIVPDSIVGRAYDQGKIKERHRHRYEINNQYRPLLEEKGMKLCGLSPDKSLVEIIEIPGHPWFVGCQFHPEYKSRPNRPHPLFLGLIKASIK